MSTTIYTELLCQFCGKSCKNNNSQRNHERLCKSNPNKQEPTKVFGKRNKPGGNKYTKATKLGLPKPVVSDETREKISSANSKTNSHENDKNA